MEKDNILEIINVTKEFPGTLALKEVKLEVKKTEVHGICGENGAGKSTLMNIIGGVFSPTKGHIFFDGKPYMPKNPKDAQTLGIGFVHQELSLCPHLSVAENIYIGRLPKKRAGMLDYKKLYKNANEILLKFNATFPSNALVSELNVSQQQIIEIAKSVSLNCKLLILDEPTSSLTEKETKDLFKIIKELASKGISILYISHRMQEIFEVCDRVTVFKDGQYVSSMNIKEISSDDIIKAMVGRKLDSLYPPKSKSVSDEIIAVKNMHSKGVFQNISFYLKRGEIVGFAGLVGSGRSEIMRALCAIDKKDSGEIYLHGKQMRFKTYKDAINNGVCYLTEDRKTQGLFLDMSVKNNISSANINKISDGIFINNAKEDNLAKKFVNMLNIKIAGINYNIKNLSGGNQQKCLIGRWLSLNPKVIIMDEPTRGIDINAKAEIHEHLRKFANDGVGVIVVSSELPEIIGLSDKVYVIYEGSLFGELIGSDITEENIMKLASGKKL